LITLHESTDSIYAVLVVKTQRARAQEIGKSLQNSGEKMPLVGGYEDSMERLGVQSWQAAGGYEDSMERLGVQSWQAAGAGAAPS